MSSGSQIVEIKSPLSYGNAGQLTSHGLPSVYTGDRGSTDFNTQTRQEELFTWSQG